MYITILAKRTRLLGSHFLSLRKHVMTNKDGLTL